MEQKSTSTIELAIQDKYMLTVKEAAAYFNMGIKKIRRLAEDNEGGKERGPEGDRRKASQPENVQDSLIIGTDAPRQKCRGVLL